MGSQVIGTASFAYTGSTGAVSVNLGTPLHDLRLVTAKNRLTLDTLDLTAREVVTYGDGFSEVEGLVRFHDAPQEIVDLVEAGLDGTTLTYTHGTTHAGIAARLIEGGPVEPDQDLVGKGQYQCRLRLRRTTAGDWSSIL